MLKLNVFAFVVRAVAWAEKRRSEPLPVAPSQQNEQIMFRMQFYFCTCSYKSKMQNRVKVSAPYVFLNLGLPMELKRTLCS